MITKIKRHLILRQMKKGFTISTPQHNKNIINDARLNKMLQGFQMEVFGESISKAKLPKAQRQITNEILFKCGGKTKVIGFYKFNDATNKPNFTKNWKVCSTLDWLYILPEYRGLGLGSIVMNCIIGSQKPFYIIPATLESEWFFKSIKDLKQDGGLFFFKNN